MVKICVQCRKPYDAYNTRQKYCSTICKQRSYSKNSFERRVMQKTCPTCGKEFVTTFKKKVYCDKVCGSRAHYLKTIGSNVNEVRTKICEQCGKEFVPKNMQQKSCSTECASIRERERQRKWRSANASTGPSDGQKRFKIKCAICGEEVEARSDKQVICGKQACKNARARETAKERRDKARAEQAKENERKKNAKSLSQLAREAREHGMQYGEYVAMIEMGGKE